MPATRTGNAFRIYSEAAPTVQTGVAIANPSNETVTATLELHRMDGSATGFRGTITLPPNGHVSRFVNQVEGLAALPLPFQGILRVSSPSRISIIGLRGHYNERNDFLITTTPAVNEAATPSPPLYFPHIADSGGYTTQFILFSVQPGAPSTGTMQLFNKAGGALGLTLR